MFASKERSSITLGLNGPTYFGTFSPFLNWLKQANPPSITRSAGGSLASQALWDAGGYLDPATGELMNPMPSDVLTYTRLFYTAYSYPTVTGIQSPSMAGETFVAKWDGSATGNVDFLTSGSSQNKTVPGQITFTQGTTDGTMQLTLTPTNVNDPPRNIRVYQSSYAANVAAGEIFNPDWLAELKQFKTLRFMDWGGTNSSTLTSYSQLADLQFHRWCSAFTASGTNGTNGPKGGCHPEIICALVAQTGCNAYVCIPHQATDAYVTAFATYMRDNTNVKVTYEYSNECWNTVFNQTTYCQTQGTASGFWPGDSAATRGQKWYGYRAAQVMKLVRDVYNDRTRWRGALGTQVVSTTVTNNALTGVNYYLTNGLAGALTVADLFNSIDGTGYFGDVTSAPIFTTLTNANPGQITLAGHGLSNGTSLRLFVARGPTALDNTNVTVTVVDANNFTIGVDTSAMPSIAADKTACRLCTNAVLPNSPTYSNGASGVGATLTAGANAALVVDTVTAALNDRVIVKNQVSTFQNGIYTVTDAGSAGTPWVLTRTTDADQPADLIKGSWASVTAGGFPNSGSIFTLDASVTTIGTDAIGFTRVTNENSYYCRAVTFDLMDQSLTNHLANPARYQTKYTYFNEQARDSFLTGTSSSGFTTGVHVGNLTSTYWPAQIAIASANGLEHNQYEGGCHFCGAIGLTGYAGNSQYTEYLMANAHSPEVAEVYAAMYANFISVGGLQPSKFVEGGSVGRFGSWAGVRYWPTTATGGTKDTSNPVWLATCAAS
jgi:hypothetical protein